MIKLANFNLTQNSKISSKIYNYQSFSKHNSDTVCFTSRCDTGGSEEFDKSKVKLPSFEKRQACLRDVFGFEIQLKNLDNRHYQDSSVEYQIGVAIEETVKTLTAKQLGFENAEKLDEFFRTNFSTPKYYRLLVFDCLKNLAYKRSCRGFDKYCDEVHNPVQEWAKARLKKAVEEILEIPQEQRAFLTFSDYKTFLMRGYFVEPPAAPRFNRKAATLDGYFPHNPHSKGGE